VVVANAQPTYLELSIALFPRGLGFLGINVCLTVRLGFGLFGFAQLGENVGCSVLGQGFRVELDSVGEVALLRVC
jgi:hypothetical protein